MRLSALTIGIVVVILVLIAACGGRSNKARQAENLLQASAGLEEASQLPADIQAQLDALVAPPGCDPALFYRLKKSFVQALAAKLAGGGKIVSVPPTGDGNVVRGLTMTADGGIYTLHWPYRNIGDYDQNGTVGITDITPIAMHFGHTVGTDPLDIVIDGDGLGSVGISDITPLAMNFAVNVTGYRVEEAADEAGPYTELGSVLLTSATGADQGWMRLQFALPDDSVRWLRVVPLDNEGAPGVPSDALNFGGAGSLPEIVSVTPLSGALGAVVTFHAVVSGMGPFTYDWQFSAAAAPASSTDEQPTVTLAIAPGDYNCSLAVSNASGFDTLDFVVSIGNPTVVSAVNPPFGLTGAVTQFTAAVTGDAPFTYDWDFGGGATPGTSFEESPTVTLGAPGIYDMASVLVSNDFGTVLFPFTLVVYSSLDPPVILNAGPTRVHGGDTITFSATIEGATPMAYAWDFGEAATPSTSGLEQPEVVITDILTTFPISLTATNAFGSDTYDFELKVNDPAMYDETEPNNNVAIANPLPAFPIGGWYCNLTPMMDQDDWFSFDAVLGDRIQVRMRLDGDDPVIKMRLCNSAGSVLTEDVSGGLDRRLLDYTVGTAGTYYVHCSIISFITMSAGDYRLDITSTKRRLDELEDNDFLGQANELSFPLDGYYGSIGSGGYDGDNDDYFVFDASPGDLVIISAQANSSSHVISAELLDGFGAPLAPAYNGHIGYEIKPTDTGPFHLHIRQLGGSGLYILSGTLSPSTLWHVSVVDDVTSPSLGSYSSLTLTGGHPGCFYQDGSNSDVYFAYCNTFDGLGAWNVIGVDTIPGEDAGDWLSGGAINGKPAAAYYKSTPVIDGIFFAMCPNADGSGLWNVSIVDPNGRYDPSVAQINGLPAVTYHSSDGNLWFGINADANAAGAWTRYQATTGGTNAVYSSLMTVQGGRPGAAYVADIVREVRFVVCSTVDGSGVWTTNLVNTNSGGKPSAAMIAGRPAVIYCSLADGSLWYSLNSAPSGLGSWSHFMVTPDETKSYVSLIEVEGTPVVIYTKANGHVYYALSSSLDGLGPWTSVPIILNSQLNSSRSLGWVNNKPACAFMHTIDYWAGFATLPE